MQAIWFDFMHSFHALSVSPNTAASYYFYSFLFLFFLFLISFFRFLFYSLFISLLQIHELFLNS